MAHSIGRIKMPGTPPRLPRCGLGRIPSRAHMGALLETMQGSEPRDRMARLMPRPHMCCTWEGITKSSRSLHYEEQDPYA